MDTDELFELTPVQQKAWNRFKSALKNLENKGLMFYNSMDTIGVTDAVKIDDYNDNEKGGLLDGSEHYNLNEVKSLFGSAWVDVDTFFHPTQSSKI